MRRGGGGYNTPCPQIRPSKDRNRTIFSLSLVEHNNYIILSVIVGVIFT